MPYSFLKRIRTSTQGFTLPEVLVALFIYTILLAGVSMFISGIYKSYKQQSQSLTSEFQATVVANKFVNELRNAAIGNDGSFSLGQAGDTQIIFYSSFGASGTAVSRIRYYRSGKYLYRGVVTPTGDPLSYNLGSEVVTAVQSDIANNATPVFYYYDGTYNGSGNALTQPVNVNNVKFVKINMILTKEFGISSSTYAVSNGVVLRNLKTNLGN